MGREGRGGKSEIHGGRGASAGVLCTLGLWMLQDPPPAQQPPVGRGHTIALTYTTLGRIPPVECSARPCSRRHSNPQSQQESDHRPTSYTARLLGSALLVVRERFDDCMTRPHTCCHHCFVLTLSTVVVVGFFTVVSIPTCVMGLHCRHSLRIEEVRLRVDRHRLVSATETFVRL